MKLIKIESEVYFKFNNYWVDVLLSRNNCTFTGTLKLGKTPQFNSNKIKDYRW